MAYGARYYFEAPGLRESVYRVDLEEEGYTGSPNLVTRDMGSIVFEVGKEGQDPTEAIHPSRIKVAVRDQSLVQEIYGEGDRAWRATVYRKPSGGSYGNGYWRGFILGDMGRFDDGTFKGPVTFEAVDGLELLKNISVQAISGGEGSFSAWEIIDTALTEIDVDFNWWLLFPWFYKLDGTSDAELSAGDEKLKHLKMLESALQTDREEDGDTPPLRSIYSVLRNALKSLNLRIMQAQGEWWVRPRHTGRYADSQPNTLQAHEYTPGSTAKNQTVQKDLVWDLDAKGGVVEKEPSNWERNVGVLRRTHDFGPFLGNGMQNGALEYPLDGWTIYEDTDDPPDYVVGHRKHKDSDYTPEETANNKRFVEAIVEYTANAFETVYVESDQFAFPTSERANEVLTVQFDAGINVRSEYAIPALQILHGGYRLDNKQTEIVGKVTQGENVIVPCKALKAPIPKGTNVVIKEKNDYDGQMTPSSKIKVTERAEPGDTRVIGNLQNSVDPDDYGDDGPPVLNYFAWTDRSPPVNARYDTHVKPADTLPGATWQQVEIVAPMVADQDSGGGVVSGTDMRIGFAFLDTANIAQDANLLNAVDEVSLTLSLGGADVTKEVFETDTGEAQSRTTDVVSYLGDGPGGASKARLFYENDDTGGRQNLLDEWDLSPFGGGNYGQRLGFLQGREYIRELREKHKRRSLTVHVQDRSQVFGPHHILKWDGQKWSIENYQYVPDEGRIEVELLPVSDDGTSSLTQRQFFDTDEEGDGASSGSVDAGSSAPVSGPSADDWSTIAGGLGPGIYQNTDSELATDIGPDSFLTTDANGLLKAEVKDENDMASNSPDHLATQRSIRQFVEEETKDITDIARYAVQTRAEIDALDAVTVRRSRSITVEGETHRVEVDASQTVEGALTKDLVLALTAPQDLHSGADFEVTTLAIDSPNTPTNGQVALGAQADETYEAVRADRKVTVTGTTNQIGVNGRSGLLTQDVSITLNAPQNLHTTADFEVETLAAGGPSSTPGDVNAAGTIYSETAVRIQSPSKTPTLLNVAGGGFFDDEINADEGIVADTYNVSTLGGSGYVLRRLQDDSTQMYSDEIVAKSIRVAEFLVNQITFSASEAISAGFVARAPISHNGGGEYEVAADTNPTVAVDDLIRAKRFTDGSHDSKARVVSVTRNGSDSTVTLQLVDNQNNDVTASASNDAPEDGFQYARIGNLSDPQRQNLIYLTASDASNPRIDFFEGVSEFSEFGASALTTRVGNLSGLSTAYSNKMGLFSKVGRFTDDVIIGDLEAGTNASVSGQYLKYDGTDIEIITASGNVETLITTNAGDISQNESDIADNEADLLLLARRITQETESRAGLEFNVGENSASIEANATVIGDDGLFSQSTLSLHAKDTESRFEASVQYTDNNNDVGGRASISLLAGPGGSDAILAGENILLDGDTEVQGGFTVKDTNIETGYRVTLRQPSEPGDGDVTGRNLRDGDIWIDTDDGDTVHTYDQAAGKFKRTHSENVVIRQASKPTQRESGNALQKGDIWIDTDDGDTVNTYDGTDFSPADNGNVTIRSSSRPTERENSDPLKKGDIWIDISNDDTVYTYDGTEWIETTTQNVVIRQSDPPGSRPSGNSLEKGDVWIETDNDDKVHTYDGTGFSPADNGNVTIRQSSPPSTRDDGSALVVGDVWIDTDADDTVHTYEGSGFEPVKTDSVVIRSEDPPNERPSGNSLEKGDVWIETDEGNAVHTYNGSSFERTRGEGSVTIRQADRPLQRPSGEDIREGDTWIDTDDGNRAYVYDGTEPFDTSGWVSTEANLRAQADQNSADVELLARRLTQSTEAQAGIEANVNENAATLTLTTKYNENTSELRLIADDASSAVELDAERVLIDGTVTATQTDFEPGTVTIRKGKSNTPNNNGPDTRPQGGTLQDGDVWINTENNDKPYTWDGGTWVASYTTISGNFIRTGVIGANRSEYEINLDTGEFLLNRGSIADEVTIGAVDASLIRKGNLTYRQGMEAGASDWTKGASGHTAQFVNSPVWSGSVALSLYTSRSTSDSSSAGTTDGYYVEIPEEIALEYGGRTVEITIWARQDTANAFAVAYSTADVGNSGWRSFFPTSNWQSFRFTYEVPEPSGGGSDYLGLLGDATTNSGATFFDAITIRPQTQRIASFEIGANRIEHFNDSGVLDVAIGSGLDAVDANETAIFGVGGSNTTPIMKVRGSSSGDYVLARGASSGVLFEVLQGGNPVFKVEDSGTSDPSVFIDELDLKDVLIEGTLTMGTAGEIIDDVSPPNYRFSSKGIELRATDSTRAEAREITWRKPDLSSGIQGEMYVHNDQMAFSMYASGSADPRTILTTYNYGEGVTPGAGDNFARIELIGDQDGGNEINMTLTGDGSKLNIRNADSGGIAFDFDPFDDYLGFKNVYDYSSGTGPSPPTPPTGIRLYTKEVSDNQERPYLWFIDENGDQYRVSASKIT